MAARPYPPATVRHFGSGQEWKVQTLCSQYVSSCPMRPFGDSIRRSSVTCTQRWQFLRPIAQGSKRWQALNLIFVVATKGTNIKGSLSSPCEPKISSDRSTWLWSASPLRRSRPELRGDGLDEPVGVGGR